MDQGRRTPFLLSLWIRADALRFCSLCTDHGRCTHTCFFPFLLYNRNPNHGCRNSTGQGRCSPFCWIRAYPLLFFSLHGSGQTHFFSVLSMDQAKRTPFLFFLWIRKTHSFSVVLSMDQGRRTPFLFSFWTARRTPFLFSVWIRADALLFCSLYGSGQTHSFLFSLKIMADAFLLCFYNHGRCKVTSLYLLINQAERQKHSFYTFKKYLEYGSRTPLTLFLQIRTVTLLSVSLNTVDGGGRTPPLFFLISSQ
jgi:hypothetical protein